ncbi:MAG: hypothetical protein K0R65_1259 [Crocinitomicaceae bacterium]|jgi:TolA-binding protein|nr:hypothetical protein [Crocinitomicaceae bacterium]
MKKLFLFAFAAAVIAACSGEAEKQAPSQKELKTKITKINDSLQVLYKNTMEQSDFRFPKEILDTAIALHLEYYRYYPKNAYAAECLDKVQQLYIQKKEYVLALKYTDTLLVKYPNYPNRATLLLNAGSTGEITQNKEVIRKYYTQLLEEFPNINAETKEMVEFRLAHLNLSFDELVELRIKEASEEN